MARTDNAQARADHGLADEKLDSRHGVMLLVCVCVGKEEEEEDEKERLCIWPAWGLAFSLLLAVGHDCTKQQKP